MTDIELQKTNTTLRRLSEEMRSYSMEKSKEKEEELRAEVDRIQSEIKILQKNNEDSATISDKLSREVRLMVLTDGGLTPLFSISLYLLPGPASGKPNNDQKG